MKRIVVAAFGNELRGDDGFGIAVLRALESRAPSRDWNGELRLLEIGTGGIRLVQELLSPCDRLIIVDAVRKGAEPGTLFVLKVESVPDTTEADMHLTVPARALALAKALGRLPPETYVIGCEPLEIDELTLELSRPVRAAVDEAARHVEALLESRA